MVQRIIFLLRLDRIRNSRCPNSKIDTLRSSFLLFRDLTNKYRLSFPSQTYPIGNMLICIH